MRYRGAMATRLLKPVWIETPRHDSLTGSDNHEIPLQPLPSGWSCNLADNALTWSRGVFDLFGIAPGTRVDRRDVVSMYTAESRAMLERFRAGAIATCGSFTMEAEICRADGTKRWMMLTADVFCRHGRPVQLYGSKLDITADQLSHDAHCPG